MVKYRVYIRVYNDGWNYRGTGIWNSRYPHIVNRPVLDDNSNICNSIYDDLDTAVAKAIKTKQNKVKVKSHEKEYCIEIETFVDWDEKGDDNNGD